MPIDASIYNNIQQPPSTLQTLGAIQQFQQRGMEIQAQQRQLAAQQQLDQAYAGALTKDENGNTKIDENALFSHIPGHLIPATMEQFAKTKKSVADLQEAQGKVQQLHADLMGNLASTVRASGNDVPTFMRALKLAQAQGLTDGPTATQYAMKAIEGGPAAVKEITDQVLAGSQKHTELDSARMTAEARKATAETGAKKLVMEAPGIQAKTAVEQQIAAGTQGGINPYQQAEIKNQQQQRAISAGQLAVAQQREKREAAKPAGADKLVKVEHKDDATGRTVIEWLPQSQLAGQKFEKGTNATTENRLASAQAVNQTGNDIIAKLSNPAYAKTLGPVLGRYSSVRDFVGNPPPEFSELAGMIESYSLANMGVHGMRSAQGAEQIKKLMDGKHTPESIVSTIRGLNAFSNHFMENEGRGGAAAVPAPSGANRVYYDMNGKPIKK